MPKDNTGAPPLSETCVGLPKSGGKPTFLTCEILRLARLVMLEGISSKDQNSTVISSWSGRRARPRSSWPDAPPGAAAKPQKRFQNQFPVPYRTAALTACISCSERTLIAPPASRAVMASTIACAPVIVVTHGTLYCKAARRIACSSK